MLHIIINKNAPSDGQLMLFIRLSLKLCKTFHSRHDHKEFGILHKVRGFTFTNACAFSKGQAVFSME